MLALLVILGICGLAIYWFVRWAMEGQPLTAYLRCVKIRPR